MANLSDYILYVAGGFVILMTCTWLIYQHFSFVWWSCKQQCLVPYYTSCPQLTNLQLLTLIACAEQVQQYVLTDGNDQ